MKKVIKSCIKWLAFAAVVASVVFKLVDMHRDGMIVRDGWKYIVPNQRLNFKMYIDPQDIRQDAPVYLKSTGDNPQAYYITHLEDGEYGILTWCENTCIAVADDNESVVLQSNTGMDNQRWTISRYEHSQRLIFTNVATGKSMYMKKSDDGNSYILCVGYPGKDDSSFWMELRQ